MKIEKNIPLLSRRCKYPFPKMDVGDSIFIDGKTTREATARRAASLYGSRNKKKFACRKVEGGVRIWRIK